MQMKLALPLICVVLGLRLWFAPLSKQQTRLRVPKLLQHARPRITDNQLISVLSSIRQLVTAGLPVSTAVSSTCAVMPASLFPTVNNSTTNSAHLLRSFSTDVDSLSSPELIRLVKILELNQKVGSPIAQSLDLLIANALSRQERNNLIRSELAGVKATVLVLALLPLLGMFLGLILGINIPFWIISEPVGRVCLVLSATFELLGIFWIRKLIARATR